MKLKIVGVWSPLLLVAACSGVSPPQTANDLPAPSSIVAGMQATYASLNDYADTGVAEYTAADGYVHAVRFATTFTRASGLRFEFSQQSHKTAPAEAWVEHGVLEETDHDARISMRDNGAAAANVLPIAGATGELQGVTLHSSMLVPRMVYGVPFCACADNVRAMQSDGEDTIAGRRTTRVKFMTDPKKAMTLWIERDTHLLSQVRITRTDEEGKLHQTIIRYSILRSRPLTGGPGATRQN